MRVGDRVGLTGLILSLVSITTLIIILIASDLITENPIFIYISFGFVGLAFLLSIVGIAIDNSLLGKIGAALSAIIFILILIFISI